MLKGSAARRRAANGRGSPRGAGGRQRTSSRQPGARRRRGAVAEIGYRPTALEAVPEEEGGRGEAASGSCRSDPSWHASWHAGSFDVASIRRALPAAAPRRAGSFDVASIRKALPAAAPRRGSGGPRKVSSKRRSALRGALAKAELDAEDDLCGALERAALRSQRVVMEGASTSADAGPEHFPLGPGQRVHFTLESPRIGRGALVIASIGSTALPSDRPVVVSTRPDPQQHSAEVVIQNTGDASIGGVFSVRFSVFAMGAMAGLGWMDDPVQPGMVRRVSQRTRTGVGVVAPGGGNAAAAAAAQSQPGVTSTLADGADGTPLFLASWQQIDSVL